MLTRIFTALNKTVIKPANMKHLSDIMEQNMCWYQQGKHCVIPKSKPVGDMMVKSIDGGAKILVIVEDTKRNRTIFAKIKKCFFSKNHKVAAKAQVEYGEKNTGFFPLKNSRQKIMTKRDTADFLNSLLELLTKK